MKKHLILSAWTRNGRRTYCGIFMWAKHCTTDESEVTCKSCLRVKASWDKVKR